MEAKAINFLLRPFKVYNTSMRPNVLLVCKILVLLLFVHNYFSYLDDPYLPYITYLDSFNSFSGAFKWGVKLIFLAASLLLLFNIHVRKMSIVLGMVVITSLLASKPMFRNHLFIIGCVFFLAGLLRKEDNPWLIYLQLSLLYFGALFNKTMEIDWWTGQFMNNWLGNALKNPGYLFASNLLPDLLLAKIISYSAMFSELIIGILLLIKSYRFYAVALILVFHTLLFSFTGETFGFFMEDVLIILIAFGFWPDNRVTLSINEKGIGSFTRILRFLDWDNRIEHKTVVDQGENVKLVLKDKKLEGYNALAYTLLYSTGFYIMLFGIELSIRYLLNGFIEYLVLLIFFWSLLFMLFPILNHRIKSQKIEQSQ